MLVVGDLSLVKVHVHTNEPGKALEYGLSLGELVNLKIENMVQQRRDKQAAAQQKAEEEAPEKEYGMVAVSLGDGFNRIFSELMVDHVVEGGQTMNPQQSRIYPRPLKKRTPKNGFRAAQQWKRHPGGPAGG